MKRIDILSHPFCLGTTHRVDIGSKHSDLWKTECRSDLVPRCSNVHDVASSSFELQRLKNAEQFWMESKFSPKKSSGNRGFFFIFFYLFIFLSYLSLFIVKRDKFESRSNDGFKISSID